MIRKFLNLYRNIQNSNRFTNTCNITHFSRADTIGSSIGVDNITRFSQAKELPSYNCSYYSHINIFCSESTGLLT